VFAWASLAWSQPSRTSAEQQATMTIYENDREVPCRVITKWQASGGKQAMQLQVIATGEMLTLLEDGAASTFQGRTGKMRALKMKIFHWGRFRNPPAGTPLPTAGEPVIINESPSTLITVGGTSTATESPPCESCNTTKVLWTRQLFGAARDCNVCDSCSPSPKTALAGCGCDCQVAQGGTAPDSASPYAPMASGITASPGPGVINENPVPSVRTSQQRSNVSPSGTTPVPMPMPMPPTASQTPSASPYGPVAGQGGASNTPGTEGSAALPGLANPARQTEVPNRMPTIPAPPVAPQIVPASPDLPQVPLPSASTSGDPSQSAVPGSQPGTLPQVPSLPVSPNQPGVTQPAPNQPVPAQVAPNQPAATTFPQPTTETAPDKTGSNGSSASDKTADTAKDAATKKRDWHDMWGDSPFANKTKQPGQTLVDPTPTGKGPALPKQEIGMAVGFTSNRPPASVTESSKQPDPLLNPERYQPPAVEKKMERAGVYVPRPAQNGMAPGGPPLPLGSVSVLAAQNGLVKQVQFVPVPVTTVPQPWRPPLPPAPEMPQAPLPNAYVNAFTSPKPQMPEQQPQPPGGAFTMPPNGGPAYGPMPAGAMPYGPMPYGPANDPRMMMAYGPMVPQGMYGPNPYMNQQYLPPSLTNSLPAYAYQQMAQGMQPQRPVAQVNYPGSYSGPMPPNPFAGQQMMPYGQPMPVYANPAMDRPGLAAPRPPSNVVAAGFNSSRVVSTLRESLYPAERESAVIALGYQDLRAQPDAVQTLLVAARHDPAGTVRAACVRCLARQQLYNEQIVNTFNELKNDQDPRVRLEVEQALAQIRR